MSFLHRRQTVSTQWLGDTLCWWIAPRMWWSISFTSN